MPRIESHYTATGFVLNKNRTHLLFIFHKKFDLWLPPGGHVEVGELPHEAVVREVFEETGILATIVDPIGDLELTEDGPETQIPAPIAIFHEKIPARKDKPAHLHYDFLYHMQAQNEATTHAEKEVAHARWLNEKDIEAYKTTRGARVLAKRLLTKH